MTTVQVVETSVTVNNNSPIQDCVQPDDQTQPTFKISFVGKMDPSVVFFSVIVVDSGNIEV